MASDDGFLRRWARRKQAAKAIEAEARTAIVPPAPPGGADAGPDAGSVAAREGAAGAVPDGAADGAAPALELPPLESLTASSDFTAFLQKGVSAAVQSRALRVAWESDEAIAGFRGMAEYAWDFNAPDYGKLWATDDVAKMVQQALRGAVPVEVEPAPTPEDAAGEDTPEGSESDEAAPAVAEVPADAAALADAGDDVAAPSVAGTPAQTPAAQEVDPAVAGVRRHGSALPG